MDVRVESNGTPKGTFVYLNGERLQHIRSLTLSLAPDTSGGFEVSAEYFVFSEGHTRPSEGSFTAVTRNVRIDPEWEPS